MIRALRARHRWSWVVLGLVAGALLIAALASRRPVPVVDALPFEAAPAPAAGDAP